MHTENRIYNHIMVFSSWLYIYIYQIKCSTQVSKYMKKLCSQRKDMILEVIINHSFLFNNLILFHTNVFAVKLFRCELQMSGGLLNMILCYCVMLIDSVIYMYWITYVLDHLFIY
jgi:hypothetical protein